MSDLICGVGINDLKGSFVGSKCPYYKRWHNLLSRCYLESQLKKSPTYRDCVVCDEWLTFSNFKKWMMEQDWEGKELDKDILKVGNKVYCPSLCVFINHGLNSLLCDSKGNRGDCKQGVSFDKNRNKFSARYKSYGKGVFIGRFKTENQAYNAYVKSKSSHIREVAAMQEPKIRDGLIRHAEALECSI